MLYLYFGSTKIGQITDEFEHQGTWYGDFELSSEIGSDRPYQRLCMFIDFCKDWHYRADLCGGGDANDFNQFRDMLSDSLWTIYGDSTKRSEITDAPMFSGGRQGEISWITSKANDNETT